MSERSVQMASAEVVMTVLARLRNGQIEDATAFFGEGFCFRDHGITLEFKDKERLAEFFHKTRELYPDVLLLTDTVFVSGDHVITQWTLQGTLTEPFYSRVTRNVPVSLQGTSIVRIRNCRIMEWEDYYDGLTARRAALASYFTEWVEL
jgi:SnoaL-like polyketide cyclase